VILFPNLRVGPVDRTRLWLAVAVFLLFGAVRPVMGQLSITKNSTTDWQITNGAITLDWDATSGNVWNVVLAGHTDNLVDTTQVQGDGRYKGLYMDNTGIGTGTVTTGYDLSQGHYLDWWITTASNASNAFTYSEHFIVFPNDPGVHAYIVFTHSPTDIAGSLGQVQYVFRISLTLFNNTYSYNSGLNNLGPTLIPQPDPSVTGTTDPGRQVQNAAVDLHGLPVPMGFTREFYTKYDYSSFEYLHEVHGVYGSTYGCWGVFPRTDSMVGGPGKQDLIFTNNICMGELLSDHLAYNLGYTPPQGVASTRLFGPVYFRFNTGTPTAMFNDALGSMGAALADWDTDNTLIASGYVPSSGRGSVAATVYGGGSNSANTAWTVLADNNANFQFTNQGNQYWTDNDSSGNAQIPGVVPGTYRLSSYVLGQWGESRLNNVSVSGGKTSNVTIPFNPENFGTSPPIWTIGTPTRSADKFLHGTDPVTRQDDREYPGAWNYWSDFQANNANGAVVYYATAVGSTPATSNLLAWNYTQWNSFDPGLYDSTNDTTDNYVNVIPSYVAHLPKASGTNGVTTACPPWQVYFTASSSQLSQGQYAVLSVGFASTDGNVTLALNGHSLTWNGNSTLKTSDASTRSGLQGTYQWVVFQWPTSDLNAAGASNEITLSTDGNVEYDALRMEITNTSAAPSTRGWYDYEYVTSGTYTPANDAVDNPSSVSALMLPSIATQPASQSVSAGASPVLNAAATGATGYQWQLNGSNIAGATSSTLTLANVGTTQRGTYTVVASNPYGSATSNAASVAVAVNSYLYNISTYGYVGSGTGQDLDAGFFIYGSGTKNILVMGAGPNLANAGNGGSAAFAGLVLAAPELAFDGVYPAPTSLLGTNSAWGGGQALINAMKAVYAPVFVSNSNDTAITGPVTVSGSNGYTVDVTINSGGPGLALVEVDDVDSFKALPTIAPSSYLANISTRGYVGAGGGSGNGTGISQYEFLDAGFTIFGSTSQTLLIRAVGPSLNGAPAPTLAKPKLALYDSAGNVIATNTGWGTAPVPGNSAVAAGIQPATTAIMNSVFASTITPGSNDCAMVVTLPSGTSGQGAYTAKVTSADGTSAGIALVEVYNLP